MADNPRANNGGHSTKAKGTVDRRRSQYRKLIKEAVTPEDFKKVLQSLIRGAVLGGDVQAAKLILEYTAGKPKDEIDIEVRENVTIKISELVSFEE